MFLNQKYPFFDRIFIGRLLGYQTLPLCIQYFWQNSIWNAPFTKLEISNSSVNVHWNFSRWKSFFGHYHNKNSCKRTFWELCKKNNVYYDDARIDEWECTKCTKRKEKSKRLLPLKKLITWQTDPQASW